VKDLPETRFAAWKVTVDGQEFILVANDDFDGDYARQLAKALGLKKSDPLPRPFDMVRLGPAYGRVK
jgi:hypothetical protein